MVEDAPGKKRHTFNQKINWTGIGLAFLAICIIALGMARSQANTFSGMRTVRSHGSVGSDNSSYVEFAEGVIRFSRDGVSYLDAHGNEQWNKAYQIKAPFYYINSNGTTGVIGDRGGNTIVVFDEKEPRGEIDTAYPVEKIAVAANGIVCAILQNGDKPFINCYDVNGNILVEHKTTLQANGYPIEMSLSPDGTMLQLSYMSVEKGSLATKIAYYNFGKEQRDNYKVTEDFYEDTIIPAGYFINKKTSILFGDNAFYIYSGQERPQLQDTIELGKEIKSVCYDQNHIVFVLRNEDTSGYELRVYDTNGSQKLSREFEGEYSNLEIQGDQIILYEGKSCKIFTMLGVLKMDGDADSDIMAIIPASGLNKYLLISADGINEVRLAR